MKRPPDRKLRIGLLMDSLMTPAWVYDMLARIDASDYAQISLLILNNGQKKPPGFFNKLRIRLKYLFFVLYTKIDRFLFRVPHDAFKNKDITTLLKDAPVIPVTPRMTKFCDYIEGESIKEIKSYDIDIFIRLGFRILKGDILRISRYGIWSYHHGDYKVNRGLPSGFWEVLNNVPITGSVLQILTDELDNGQILFRSLSGTDISSVNRNRNKFYRKSQSFLPRKLEELYNKGDEEFFKSVTEQNKDLVFYSQPLYTAPGNWQLFGRLIKYILRYARIRINYILFYTQWFLMYDLRDQISTSLWRYKKMLPPVDRFWADPHVIFRGNYYYIFIEEYMYKSRKGHISVIKMDDKGNYEQPVKVLDRPYHLSYPFVMEYENDYYMIPESKANRTIEVYKCQRFPDMWEPFKVLMKDIAAADATLFYHNNKWWMFVNIVENPGASVLDELFLFYADTPFSESWTPHPRNPIVSDVTSARPAGKIFTWKNDIYRPSQNSIRGYGYGIKMNKILTLDENDYQEIEVTSIEPNWDKKIKGVHTFNHENKLSIIDARFLRWNYLQNKRY
ncbi:MAG TPA: hypothetical protein PLP19_08025 [bacterium]|nr:hypothetical protein [bacterium]HPN43419.1 hypothetical protein [bacterium]